MKLPNQGMPGEIQGCICHFLWCYRRPNQYANFSLINRAIAKTVREQASYLIMKRAFWPVHNFCVMCPCWDDSCGHDSYPQHLHIITLCFDLSPSDSHHWHCLQEILMAIVSIFNPLMDDLKGQKQPDIFWWILSSKSIAGKISEREMILENAK